MQGKETKRHQFLINPERLYLLKNNFVRKYSINYFFSLGLKSTVRLASRLLVERRKIGGVGKKGDKL